MTNSFFFSAEGQKKLSKLYGASECKFRCRRKKYQLQQVSREGWTSLVNLLNMRKNKGCWDLISQRNVSNCCFPSICRRWISFTGKKQTNKQKQRPFCWLQKHKKKFFFNPVDLLGKLKLPLKCLTKMVSFI